MEIIDISLTRSYNLLKGLFDDLHCGLLFVLKPVMLFVIVFAPGVWDGGWGVVRREKKNGG